MKQSEDIAAKRSTHQQLAAKFKPSIELCERINTKIMESLAQETKSAGCGSSLP